MEKCEAWADVPKNRLYIKVTGFLTDEETREWVDAILQELEKLKPDFDFIADLSAGKAATQEGTKQFNRIYEAFKAKNVRRDILIVKDDIIQMQLQRKARDAGFTKEEYAASIEEAERMLEEDRPS